jgi:hypothetical protein
VSVGRKKLEFFAKPEGVQNAHVRTYWLDRLLAVGHHASWHLKKPDYQSQKADYQSGRKARKKRKGTPQKFIVSLRKSLEPFRFPLHSFRVCRALTQESLIARKDGAAYKLEVCQIPTQTVP